MKNKVLSYLLWWLLILLPSFLNWYVEAQGCADSCSGLWDAAFTDCMKSCNGWSKDNEPQTKQESKKCNWIKLNTNFPIIWNCIWDDAGEDATKAFPSMIWAFTKIVMALILVWCFIIIIYAGILWAADKPKEAKEWLKRVAITILLLWFSGAILKLINPNFFTS